MKNIIIILFIVNFFALIVFIVRNFHFNNQYNKKSNSTGDKIIQQSSPKYRCIMSSAKSLAETTVKTVQSQMRLKTTKFLFCTDVTTADTIFFSCFILRAICISSTRNRTQAEMFSDSYISHIVRMTKEVFYQEDTIQEMFYNRTKFYDQIIAEKGGLQNGIPALLQEFELIIETDMINNKYVPFGSNSPITIIDFFDSVQCRAEIYSFFEIILGKAKKDVDKAIDSIQ